MFLNTFKKKYYLRYFDSLFWLVLGFLGLPHEKKNLETDLTSFSAGKTESKKRKELPKTVGPSLFQTLRRQSYLEKVDRHAKYLLVSILRGLWGPQGTD